MRSVFPLPMEYWEKRKYYLAYQSSGYLFVIIEWLLGGMKESDNYMANLIAEIIENSSIYKKWSRASVWRNPRLLLHIKKNEPDNCEAVRLVCFWLLCILICCKESNCEVTDKTEYLSYLFRQISVLLLVNYFIHYDFLRGNLTGIHLCHPFKRIGRFQLFINTTGFGELCSNQTHLFLRRDVYVMEIRIQPTLCQKCGVGAFPILLYECKAQTSVFTNGVVCLFRQNKVGVK